MGPNARGALLALIAFGIFATHDVVVKTLGGVYSPIQIIFFSTLLSFPLVMFMLIRDQSRATLQPVHPWWTLLRTACAVATALLAFYAFSVLPLAQTYAILFAAPLLITVLAIPILGEPVRWRRGVAVLVGLAGVIVVLRPGVTDLTFGHLAALGAAIFGATASVIVRKIGRDERSIVLLLYPMIASFILMAALLPAVYIPMPLEDLALVGVISALGFSAGLVLIGAYKRAEAAIVAPMQYSQILWATGYGYLLFGETIDRPTLIGAGIIIASGLYIVLREGRTPGSQTPVLRTRARGYGSSFRISPFLNGSRDRPED
ncbi:DMT family transporter [Pseudaestuariivita atlantica]|uniref:Membrane protein n=1 Tax=Pseudaestuariivita atlantica TaxID=1317121 RepID=A0A0L1JNQ6_9RHOB|nr:DMT family transporter [Pseudaestuariivita atlantica]KNG93394.1 membrane protein [Pseudaestuariivita atlantica]